MPLSSRPMPIGQVIGAVRIFSTFSISSSSSIGGRPSRSSLLMNVMIGVSRRRHTSISLHRALLDALGTVDDHECRIDRRQSPVGIFREILVARRVEQIDDAVAVGELHHRGGDRDAALLLEAHPVGGRMTCRLAPLDGASHLDGAAEQQQLLGQRGLAGVGVRDDGEGTSTPDLVRNFLSQPEARARRPRSGSFSTQASSRPPTA